MWGYSPKLYLLLRLCMEKFSSFPVYGAVMALMRKKGDMTWLNFGCFRYPCFWYDRTDVKDFCILFMVHVNRIDNSCDFEFAVKVGLHVFLLVEQDGIFNLPVELVD